MKGGFCDFSSSASFPRVVLAMEAALNILLVIYNSIDPIFLRGVFPMVVSVVIIISALTLFRCNDSFYQLYWLHLTKKYRFKAQFFMEDRGIKIIFFANCLVFVFSLIFLTVLALLSPVPGVITTVLSIFALGLTVLSTVILASIIFVTSYRLFKIFKVSTVPKERAKQITSRLILCFVVLIGGYISLQMIFPVFFPLYPYVTTDLSPEFCVWLFYSGALLGETCLILSSLTKILSFKAALNEEDEPTTSC